MRKFDPSIFEINRDFSVKLYEIGNQKSRLIEVDNFFLYPDQVREFLLSLPTQDATNLNFPRVNFFPGYQLYLRYELKNLHDFFKEALFETFKYKLDSGLVFAYQIIDGNHPVYKQSCLPHSDVTYFAANVFLNYDHEIGESSGTAFYRSKHTGNELSPPFQSPYRIARDFGNKPADFNRTRISTITQNDDWEMYHLSEQKFNRLNMYEGFLYHSAFVKFNTFTQTPRISFTVGERTKAYDN